MNDKELFNRLVRIRRQIHQNPELGNREFKTAALIEKILRSLRIPCKRVSRTGVVGLIGKGPGPCIALRADMDALPLKEKRTSGYASKTPGVMHACGHDAHVAMLLGAAMILAENKIERGSVKLLFQPNEEGAGGAKGLIAGNAMKNPRVNAVFGLHVNPRLAPGIVGLKHGPLMAAVDWFEIEVIGKGGHAAYPHEGQDAVVIASEIVQSLQTIHSRNIDPLEPAVITVGTIQGGTRFNILADKVVMTGTVRTLSEEWHRKIPQRIREIAKGIAGAHGARALVRYEVIGSVLSNHEAMTLLAEKTAARLFGTKRVERLARASMGGEDFAEYLKLAPGCFIYIGTGSSSTNCLVPWHHPEFDIDERALPVGAKLLASLARDFLNGGPIE